MSSVIYEQRRPRSDCASAQSDQGLYGPFTDSLDTTEYMNGERRPRCYFVHAQDDLKQRILRMFEGTFSLDPAHVCIKMGRCPADRHAKTVDRNQTLQNAASN